MADDAAKKPNTSRWVKGGKSPNPGGRRKSVVVAWDKLREHAPDAVDALVGLYTHPEWEARKWAISYTLDKLGRVPTEPETTPQQLPKSPEATKKKLEELVTRAALDGDTDLALRRLEALAPNEYGDGDKTPSSKATGGVTLNLVGLGQGRPGHLVRPEDDS